MGSETKEKKQLFTIDQVIEIFSFTADVKFICLKIFPITIEQTIEWWENELKKKNLIKKK